MGWRSRLGVAEKDFEPKAPELSPEKEPKTPFAAFTDRAEKPKTEPVEEAPPPAPAYKIEALTHCLHGRKCLNLISKPPARPLCRISGEPVFDLTECPAGQWRSWRDGLVTEIMIMPKKG